MRVFVDSINEEEAEMDKIKALVVVAEARHGAEVTMLIEFQEPAEDNGLGTMTYIESRIESLVASISRFVPACRNPFNKHANSGNGGTRQKKRKKRVGRRQQRRTLLSEYADLDTDIVTEMVKSIPPEKLRGAIAKFTTGNPAFQALCKRVQDLLEAN